MNEILSGIYKIYCKETDKYYIGQSVDVKNRINQHLRELKNKTHINRQLQEDFNNYGEKSFIFEKIKDVEEEFLNIFEKYYMEYYNSIEEGYNVIPMNNLIKDKYKNKNGKHEDIINNSEPTEVNVIAGDYYFLDICSRLDYLLESISDYNSFISDNLLNHYYVLQDYIRKNISPYSYKIDDEIELKIRRAFNKAGITDVEIDHDWLNSDFLENKEIPISITLQDYSSSRYVAYTKVKCSK